MAQLKTDGGSALRGPAQPQSRSSALALFFASAYAWTWLFNLAKILSVRGALPLPVPSFTLDMAAGLGPLVAALAAATIEAGAHGRRALLGPLLHWRVSPRWYAVALVGPVVVGVLAYAMWVSTGGSPPPSEALSQWRLLPVFFLYILVFGGGLGEEMGWRGYALKPLQDRYGALRGSLLLGILWSGWHIPAWFIPGSGQHLVSFPVFVLSTTAAAVILTSIFNSTQGSLPVVTLAHTVFNLCFSGPWFRALYALPPDQQGADPFTLLSVLVGLAALCVIIFADPCTLTIRSKRS